MQTATTADDSGNYVSSVVSETYGGDDPDLQISGVLDMAYYSYNSQNYSKMIVMGNAEFMDDEHVASGYTLVPLYLCLSSITWMYNSDIDMEIDDKERSFDYMYFETSDDAQMIMGVMIALPAIMAVLGIAVWLKRRNHNEKNYNSYCNSRYTRRRFNNCFFHCKKSAGRNFKS